MNSKHNPHAFSVLLIALLMALCSCEERFSEGAGRMLQSSFKAVAVEGWSKDDTIAFVLPAAEDSTAVDVELTLLVRATNAYPYTNLAVRTFRRASGTPYVERLSRRLVSASTDSTLRIDTTYTLHHDSSTVHFARVALNLFLDEPAHTKSQAPQVKPQTAPNRTTAHLRLGRTTLPPDSAIQLLVVHNMRDWTLAGITDIGLRVEQLPTTPRDIPTRPAANP